MVARPTSLDTLQAGRAFAALAVVLFHLNIYAFGTKPHMGGELSSLFNMGYAGVEFFFVLSGFLMMHVHHADLGRPEKLAAYARKRAVRIYPMYWIVSSIN
jgi:exopolysaccharide production protein ExoZ